MRMSLRVWSVAAALAAVLLGDALGFAHVRGELDERAARARALDDAWVLQVREIAIDLQAARAPIADAADLVLLDLAPAVRYDVYVRGSAGADFAALQERLSSVAPAAGREPVQNQLIAALDAMTEAVVDLANEKDEDVEDESRAFDAAALSWDVALAADVARDLPLATTDRGDVPLTDAGRIFRWSTACARGLLDDEQAGEPGDDPAQAATVFEAYARTMDNTLDALLAVPVSRAQAQAQAQRDLEPALRGLRGTVDALEDFAAAVRARDHLRIENALLALDRVAPLLDSAARAFQAAGSSLCTDYFDPGLVERDPSPGDDLSQT